MWRSSLAVALIASSLMLSNIYAAEFSSEKLIGQQLEPQAVQTQLTKESQTKACPVSVSSIVPLTEVQENKNSKIVVKYRGVPVTIPASKVTNVIVFPYQIESVGSSKFCSDNKFGSNCINSESIGKGEKQFSVVPVQGQDTDFVVTTSKQTYVITLRPQFDTPSYIEIIDESESVSSTNTECMSELNYPYVDYLIDLIGKAIRGEKPEGFYSNQISQVYETPELLFVFKKEIVSTKEPVKVVFIDIINKTKNVLQIREDSKLLEVVISKVAGKPLAVSLSREFIQPITSESERKSEQISTCVAVVRKK
ncbi:hypothetical protein [Thermodesulfovibrio sp. TK110]